jgi:restriction system protein
MAIPDFQSLMLPFLKAIGDGNDHANSEITQALAQQYKLTEEELQQKLPSGESKLFYNRVAWAKAYLKKAGLLVSLSRTSFRITDQGTGVLAKNPPKIDIAFLKQFPSMDWHKKKETVDEPEVADTEHTPEEILEASYQDLRVALADDLLEQVKTCSPTFFERLVVDLLVAMGYGGSLADAGQAIGKTGDGGIDGIIKEDKLGLDVVCVQAKRWENTVGRPVVQAFAGSMDAFKAKKGVLITTASFSKEAAEFVKQIDKKIVLIDGMQLAQLMIDHDIGVTTARTYTVKKVDQDYFVEDEV